MPSPLNADRVDEELERLLSMAEHFQEKCDRNSARLEASRALALVLSLLLAFAGFSLGMRRFGAEYLFIGGIWFSAVLMFANIQNSAKRRLARDRRALAAIVGLLRETESGLLMQGRQFSTFELAQFRIRISRFEIGAEETKPSGTSNG